MSRMDMKKRVNKSIDIILLLGMISYIAVFAFINIYRTWYGTGPDETQTAIVSRIFWEHKSLFPKEFFPWTESGIFSLPTIGMFIYGLTGNLVITQGVTPTIIMVLILLAFYKLLSVMEISRTGKLIGMLAILCVPCNFVRQSIAFVSYAAYGMTILTMFLVLADYIMLVSGKMKHKWIYLIFHLCLAFANGCNSSRGVLDVYAPLVALECVRYFILILKQKKIWIKEQLLPLCFSVSIMLCSFLTTYLPISSRQITSKAFRQSPVKLIEEVLPAMMNWLGMYNKHIQLGLVPLFLLCLAIGVYIVYTHKIDDMIQLVIAFMWAAMIITIVLLSVTQTDVVPRYFFMFYYIIIFSALLVFERWNNNWKLVIPTLVVLCGIMNMKAEYIDIVKTPVTRPEYDEIVSYMEENDDHYGYSDYMNANPLTLWSNGKVQVSSVYFKDLSIWMWTTSSEYYVPTVDENTKSVIIVPKNEMEDIPEMLEKYPDIKEGMETENFIVYTCEKNHAVCEYERVN